MTRIAVLGCGSIGQRHLRNLRALGLADLDAVDPDPIRRGQAEALGVRTHADPATALRAEPDAVFVCTPPALHASGLRSALDAGADVFVEKPLASSLEGIDELLARAERDRRVVMVGYNLRFDAALRALRASLERGDVGRALLVRAEFGQYLPDWRPSQDWRAGYNASAALGGGVLLDQSHEIDEVRWLAGEVRSVSATAEPSGELGIEVEDLALLVLRLESGAIASVQLDSVRRDYARGCLVIGSEGTLEWTLRGGARVKRAGDDEWTLLAPASDPNEMYVAEARHFLERMRDRGRPEVDGAEGRRVLEIALAAKRAAVERREIAV